MSSNKFSVREIKRVVTSVRLTLLIFFLWQVSTSRIQLTINMFREKFEQLTSVNRRMIIVKFIYLLNGGSMGSSHPFFNAMFRSFGLSSSQAGIITGVRYATGFVFGPLWGLVVDYTGRRKLVLSILCAGSSLFLFSSPWIAAHTYNPTYHNQTSKVKVQ